MTSYSQYLEETLVEKLQKFKKAKEQNYIFIDHLEDEIYELKEKIQEQESVRRGLLIANQILKRALLQSLQTWSALDLNSISRGLQLKQRGRGSVIGILGALKSGGIDGLRKQVIEKDNKNRWLIIDKESAQECFFGYNYRLFASDGILAIKQRAHAIRATNSTRIAN